MRVIGYLLLGLTLAAGLVIRLAEIDPETAVAVLAPLALAAFAILLATHFSLVPALVFATLPFANIVPLPKFVFVTPNIYSLALFTLFPVLCCRALFGKIPVRLYASFLFLLALVVFFILSAFSSGDPFEYGRLIFSALLVPFVGFCAAMLAGTNPYTYTKTLTLFTWSAAAFGLCVLASAVMTGERASALGYPYISAATILFAAFLVAWYGKTLFSPAARRALCIVTALALLSTFPRVYLLLLLCSPFFMAVIHRNRTTALFLAMHFASLAALFLLFDLARNYGFTYAELRKAQAVMSAFDRLTDFTYLLNSLMGRFHEYELAVRDFVNNPLFGVGMVLGRHVVTPHNYHMELLQYGGISGFTLYTGFLASFFLGLRRSLAKDQTLAVNSFIVLAIIINGLTNGLMHGLMPVVMQIFMGLSLGRALFLDREAAGERGL